MKRLTIFLCCLAFSLPALASPGAHGPNGEHLDGAVAAASTGTEPRVETATEAFELVGHLSGGELSVLIDRYDTNEPVLNGKLEVQYKGMKAQAKFHADIGDYAIDDPTFLQALAAPGKHQLLFTFVAGDESDLLDGTLEVSRAASHDNTGIQLWSYLAAGAAIFILAGSLLMRRRKSKPNR